MDLEGIAELLTKGLEGGAGVGYIVMNAVVMLAAYLVNVLLKDSIPAKAKVWVAMGLGAVLMLILAKYTGRAWGQSAILAVIGGVLSGTAAGGTWSAGGKQVGKLAELIGKKKNGQAPPAPPAPPEEPKP